MLREKALEINQKLGEPTDFKASTGSLKNFKSCCGIRKLEVQGESLSSNALAADKQKIWWLFKNEGYSLDDVYNTDETRNLKTLDVSKTWNVFHCHTKIKRASGWQKVCS